tara:strand:+ start:132 stop:383 length:252 start_codon:yes stop_codon:yes gene_type:complete
MTLYKCKCGKEKELSKATIVLRDTKWVAKEAECLCGKYMDSEPTEGIPTLQRTEPSLTKKRDKLWAGAKEKLVGEKGINESYD